MGTKLTENEISIQRIRYTSLSELESVFSENKKKISATGILTCNMIVINDHTVEWIEAADFSLAALAKSIGIDHDHKAKATITIEFVEEPCMLCGKPTTGDKICQNCGKPVCDECAETENPERYCPLCQVLKQPNQPTNQ